MTEFERLLREVLAAVGVSASAKQLAQFCAHYELLERWNRRINLTGIRSLREIAHRHFGESAFLHRELPPVRRLVDVGSGAGFPGLPAAVLRPECEVTLVESKLRKAAFLREVSRSMSNVTVAPCRVAEWQGSADWAVLRAVAPSKVLPDLEGRVARVAVLGTDRPEGGRFGHWKHRASPWSRTRKLWTGKAL